MKNNYLYIFVHGFKTGGTTLVKHLLKNFPKEEILNLTYKELGIYPDKGESADWQKIVFGYVARIPENKRKRIKVILGHILPYGIHRFFSSKPRYLTFIRQPGARTLSFYNYYRRLFENEKHRRNTKKLYQYLFLVNRKLPSFADWYQNKYLKPGNFVYQSQTDYYRTLGYFKNRPKLDKFFFVGITEKSKEDLLYLYYLLGFNKFFIDQNISKKFVARHPAGGLAEKKFYQLALAVNAKFKKANPDFFQIVRRVRQQRTWLLPLTQVIFDFTETLHQLSAKIRTKSRLYGKIWDFLKRL